MIQSGEHQFEAAASCNETPTLFTCTWGVRKGNTAKSSCRGNAKNNNPPLIPGNNAGPIQYRGRGC